MLFNLSLPLQIAPGDEDSTPINYVNGNDLEGLLLHELGHAAIGLGHPLEGDPATQVDSVMYVGPGCCLNINRQLAADDIAGARHVYGLRGDIDRDGHVNVFDVFIIAEGWNTAEGDPAFNPDCDLDYDGFVNVFDIFVLAENWNL